MKYQLADIVVIDFPFSDLTGSKKRPALVISNIKGDNCILCQITSKKSKIDDYQTLILKEIQSTNLSVNSYVRSDLLFTLSKSLILGKIGNIDEVSLGKVKQKIAKVFEL